MRWHRWVLISITPFVALSTGTAESGPIAGSPGGSLDFACPSFAWRAGGEFEAFELVVYRIGDDDSLQPVLEETVAGADTSWVPEDGACLEPGGRYAWSVRAVAPRGPTEWSEPMLFEILPEAEPESRRRRRRRIDRGDGTVLDTRTGLVWLAQADCFGEINGVGEAGHKALFLADGQCGLTDGSRPGEWQMPTKDAWERTMTPPERECRPAIGDGYGGCWNPEECEPECDFVGIQARYWSSTRNRPEDEGWYRFGDFWYADLRRGRMATAGPHDDWPRLWPVRTGVPIEGVARLQVGELDAVARPAPPVGQLERFLDDLTARAEGGDATSQAMLAVMYERGIAVDPDPALALRWIQAAADQGSSVGITLLARAFARGIGVEADDEKALYWFALEARTAIASFSPSDLMVFGGTAEGVFRAAEGRGPMAPRAQGYVGVLYLKGEGVDPSDAEAVRWLERAARGGLSEAQRLLGLLSQEGRGGLPADATKALRLYLESADAVAEIVAGSVGVTCVQLTGRRDCAVAP